MSSIKFSQGEDVEITVRLRESTGDPLDLTTATDIHTCFLNLDGTKLALSVGSGVSVVSAVLGKILITVTAAQSALLRPVVNGDLEVTVDMPSNKRKKLFERVLTIQKSAC